MSVQETANSTRQSLTIPDANRIKASGKLNVHAVVLTNYVRPHHVVAFQEFAKRVRKLTVLLSVPMEADRNWDAQWGDLDVRVQKNWTYTAKWRHSSGFNEANFIHIPIDTNSQLKSLKPDIVFSYEMGMRTLLSSWYRGFHSKVPLVMVGNMSQHIEKERGLLRRSLRSIIRRGVDYYTYNGPSCKRYLESLSISDDRLFHVPYCIDPEKVFTGQRIGSPDSNDIPRRFLYCGAISERKGIVQFSRALKRWCERNPEKRIELSIAGSGELKLDVEKCQLSNLLITFLGNCNTEGLREAYGQSDVCVFPSLADEWGLVPIEAMASGVPVLGSVFAQSVEAVVEEGQNGWEFEPTDFSSMFQAIDRCMKCSSSQLIEMGRNAKESVASITPQTTASKFCEVIQKVLPDIQLIEQLNEDP